MSLKQKNIRKSEEPEVLKRFIIPVILRNRADVLSLIGRNEEAVKDLRNGIDIARKTGNTKYVLCLSCTEWYRVSQCLCGEVLYTHKSAGFIKRSIHGGL